MEIVNKSLATGDFTSNLKETILQLLWKKLGLELQLKNYRPVSNQSYISKIIEHVVCNQLVEYTAKSSNFEQFQLAYRKGHSTETTLLKVKMDFLVTDNRKVICLVLLNLSAIFDVDNHSLLLNMLKYRFRVDGTVLNWLHNYLTYRSQKAVIDAD